MHQSSFTRILTIFAFAAFIGGCASLYGSDHGVETDLPNKQSKLAILPFISVSEARGAGMIVADILANQLYALGNHAVVTPEIVSARMADRESELLSPSEAGDLVGAQYVLAGRVTEYTYKSGVGETPVIGVTARLLDASTGAVLWSSTRTGRGGGNWFQEDSLSRLTVLLCKDLADSLNEFLEKHHLTDHAFSSAPAGGHKQ